MKQHKLIVMALILMAIGLLVSAFTLFYFVSNKDAISSSIESSLRAELAKYNVPVQQNISIDDAKILLSVAKYCQANNNCMGKDGKNGVNGTNGSNGLDSLSTHTVIETLERIIQEVPIPGPQGEPGQNAPKLERRCNSELNRMEYRYQGDEFWVAEFNLSPLQTCVNEGVL